MTPVDLSAWFVYAILCGGWDVGSNIGDALSLLESQGTCPDSEVAYKNINPRNITATAKADAANYKILIGAPLTSFAEMMTATQMGMPGNFSIRVGANFNKLDSDGVPGHSIGPGNHAVTFGIGAKKAKNGEWLIKCQNSWNTSWGLGGYFWIRESSIAGQMGFEAYCVQAVATNPSDARKLPKAA